jgi:hypothetical protein
MVNNNDDKIIPVEIRMLKFSPKAFGKLETSSENSNKTHPLIEYLRYFRDRYKKYNDVNNEPKIFVFRCYGWFDYLL